MKTINRRHRLLGVVLGDMAGSMYEFSENRDYNVPLFPDGCDYTDDSILTMATAQAVLENVSPTVDDFSYYYRRFAMRYPHPKGAYGSFFSRWIESGNHREGYNSLGNGAVMRVAPCAYTSNYVHAMWLATCSSVSTHNHWQAVRAAQALVSAIFWLNHGMSVDEVTENIEQQFHYDLHRSYEQLHATYVYSGFAEHTVDAGLICALRSSSFEDALRKAVSLGGDADTIGAVTGAVAECIHEIPKTMVGEAEKLLPQEFKDIIAFFNKKTAW
jgi:ADP-ribosyl-[dinitrogen reductase] hydrolase